MKNLYLAKLIVNPLFGIMRILEIFLNDNQLRFIESIKFGEDIVFLFQTVPMDKTSTVYFRSTALLSNAIEAGRLCTI